MGESRPRACDKTNLVVCLARLRLKNWFNTNQPNLVPVTKSYVLFSKVVTLCNRFDTFCQWLPLFSYLENCLLWILFQVGFCLSLFLRLLKVSYMYFCLYFFSLISRACGTSHLANDLISHYFLSHWYFKNWYCRDIHPNLVKCNTSTQKVCTCSSRYETNPVLIKHFTHIAHAFANQDFY